MHHASAVEYGMKGDSPTNEWVGCEVLEWLIPYNLLGFWYPKRKGFGELMIMGQFLILNRTEYDSFHSINSKTKQIDWLDYLWDWGCNHGRDWSISLRGRSESTTEKAERGKLHTRRQF